MREHAVKGRVDPHDLPRKEERLYWGLRVRKISLVEKLEAIKEAVKISKNMDEIVKINM